MSPPLLAIIADDLTGALDAAAPFAARGARTLVALDPASLAQAVSRDPEIVAVSTGSREVSAAEARSRVGAALAALPPSTRLFKKIDSRLKGHVAAELSVFPAGDLAILPAIPEFGRIVRDGAVTGFGVDEPISISDILGALATRASIPDTTTTTEMARALAAIPETALLVGARGLADALARRLFCGDGQAVTAIGTRLTFVIGSRDPITLAQIAHLRAAEPDLAVIEAPNGVAADPAPGAARFTLLQATPGAGAVSPEAVANNLSVSLKRHARSGRDGLLISGGATAEIVLAALGVTVLDVLGEVLPGLPVSRAGDVAIVSKSGGFGDADALARVAAAVARE